MVSVADPHDSFPKVCQHVILCSVRRKLLDSDIPEELEIHFYMHLSAKGVTFVQIRKSGALCTGYLSTSQSDNSRANVSALISPKSGAHALHLAVHHQAHPHLSTQKKVLQLSSSCGTLHNSYFPQQQNFRMVMISTEFIAEYPGTVATEGSAMFLATSMHLGAPRLALMAAGNYSLAGWEFCNRKVFFRSRETSTCRQEVSYQLGPMQIVIASC